MRTTSSSQVAAAIDATVTGPMLVVGSVPITGSHLHLLAPAAEYDAVVAWLGENGFVRWRQSWARFDGTEGFRVDVSSALQWRPGAGGWSLLLEDAEAVPGFENLLAPGPATVLLLAARRLVGRWGRMTDDDRGAVGRALAQDPEAWSAAARRARPLGLGGALRLLQRASEADRALSPAARVAGLAGVVRHEGPLGAKARVLVEARPGRWRPAVVSFSGLDGSGKSTQGSQLRATLADMGVDAEVQWAGFKTGSSVRRALPFLDRSLPVRRRTPLPAATPAVRDPLVPKALLDHPLGQQAWMSLVVVVNAISLWRYVLVRRSRSDVVIFDRFSPDSAVKIEFHFRGNRAFDTRWPRALFDALSPRADVAFLVAVPGEVAYGRRQEQTLEELTAMATLYDEQVARFDLLRLDGTEPADALSRRVVNLAWQGLR